jgi:hypothetical protein
MTTTSTTFAGKNIDLTGEQQTKTRKTLEYFAGGLDGGVA